MAPIHSSSDSVDCRKGDLKLFRKYVATPIESRHRINGFYLFLSQFCSTSVNPFSARRSSIRDSVTHIFQMTKPLKIFKSVIRGITVDMVRFFSSKRQSGKRPQEQLMHISPNVRIGRYRQMHIPVATLILRLFKQSFLKEFQSMRAKSGWVLWNNSLNTTIGTNGIRRKLLDYFPNFFFGRSQYGLLHFGHMRTSA